MPLWLQLIGTLLLGLATGALSSALGVGGAVVSTPGIRALGATAIQGVGSTLPAILPSALTGSLRYSREGLVLFEVVRKVAPWGAVAAVGGAIASARFPGQGHVQMILTAVLVLYTSWSMSRSRSPELREAGALTRAAWWRCAPIGLGAGALSGFLGIGGGILMVPTFSGWLKLGLKETVATSLTCVGILAIPGTITHIVEGSVAWSFAAPLFIGVIPGAHLGSRWTIVASERHLRLMIGVALGAMGACYMVAETLALAS